MGTEGDGAPEPSKEPSTRKTPSPGKRNVDKSKRLLPMELRKRRRAAKLQVSAEKKARVSLDPARTPTKPARSPNKATPVKGASVDTGRALGSNEAVEEETRATPATGAAKKSLPLARTEKKLPHPAAAATAKSLSSLYSSSALTQKRQRRLLLSGAHVPKKFQVVELPLDIVPKTKLSILTAFPYPFQRLNSQIKKEALQGFIRASGSNTKSVSQSAAVRWQQALHYFVHPAAPVPTSILLNRAAAASSNEPLLGGLKGERKREEKAFFTARWNTWQESFRDVYMNFRRQTRGSTRDVGKDGTFYLRSSDFVVCFLYDNDTGAEGDLSTIINLCQQYDKEPESSEEATCEGSKRTKKLKLCAVMSQSNARIRKVLHHLNVEYTMPYINTNQTQREVGEFHLLEEEREASRSRNKERSGSGIIATMGRTASVQENMHGADSLLLFHGHDAVHGLYEFLINRAPMSNQDVPELYALHPFANASIQSLRVTSFGRVGGSVTGSLSEDHPSKAATLFRTEILGFCFPSSVAKLLAVLKAEWEATRSSHGSSGGKEGQVALRTYMEAVAGAERLNAAKLDEQVSNGPGENHEEQDKRQNRQQELEFSKRRVETVVVTTMESRYDVEITAQSIAVRR